MSDITDDGPASQQPSDAPGRAQPVPAQDAAGIPSANPPKKGGPSIKHVVVLGLFLLVIAALAVFLISRLMPREAEPEGKSPKVASSRQQKLVLDESRPREAAPPPPAAQSNAPTPVVVPRLDAPASPIPLSGSGRPGAAQPRPAKPEDSPIFAGAKEPPGLSRAREGLDAARDSAAAYNDQAKAALAKLQGLMGQQGRPAAGLGAPSQSAAVAELEPSSTPRVAASMLGDRSLTMPKGTLFTCALKTKVVTSNSGLVGCQVLRNIYGDDGKVVLVERGSHLDGEYRIVQVKPGVTRIPVLWSRVRTPHGVVVQLDSPATGGLGESGLGGYVDNRWGERIGAAMLLSLIEDAVQVVSSDGNTNGGTNNNFNLGNTSTQSQKLAERVLEATINIPPLIYQNQGAVAGVYVARDVDFSGVYALEATR